MLILQHGVGVQALASSQALAYSRPVGSRVLRSRVSPLCSFVGCVACGGLLVSGSLGGSILVLDILLLLGLSLLGLVAVSLLRLLALSPLLLLLFLLPLCVLLLLKP